LPWLGYLDKMAKADVFVIMDDLQYEAQNFQNRNRVKLNHGTTWLTVPLASGSQSDRICDKKIQNQWSPKEHWQRRTWMTLETHYRRAPFFAAYADELREVYTRSWDTLAELDAHVLELARKWLGIDTPIVRSSELGLEGYKTERILDMCQKLGATSYLSGSGGSQGYLDAERLGRAGIGVVWQSFEHPVYAQRYSELGFIPNLAFLDLVLNCGPAAAEVLFPASHPSHALHETRLAA
ncbi:MAG TPA: WbqC family protein, partial [Acidimicrobiia bacterium]